MTQALSKPVYDFETQHTQGKRIEREVSVWLQGFGYETRPARYAEQRRGIDIICLRPKACTIDVKADFIAHATDKIFIEILSSCESGRLSWFFTSEAKRLFYVLVATGDCYIVDFAAIRAEFARAKWASYEWRSVLNTGEREYTAAGVLVPVSAFAAICKHRKIKGLGQHGLHS